jgi:glycosyltransferase involved in cell wall biosynthesis
MSQLRDDGPFLSIVIPCYNEEKNLERGVLQEVHEYLVTRDYVWEVIVANDESTDSSRRLIKRFTEGKPRFSLVDIPHGGKPAAVWAGIREARGEIVLFTDMDQSTPLEEVEKLLPWYDQGCDVVIGSRGTEREGFSIVRRLGSAVFRTLRRLFLLRGISDTQCGFKSCKREAALEVFPQLQFFKQKDKPVGWKVSAYDVELLHLFEKAGYQLREVEVAWLNRDESVTKDETGALARYMRESLEMTREVLRVRVNELKGLYDV